jgi:glutamate synthase domain-containing protein 3
MNSNILKPQRIDAGDLNYRELNRLVKDAANKGVKDIHLTNVNGQRYIGTGVNSSPKININGVPGNDLGAFMDGCSIDVSGNGEDGIGNTMNSGRVVINGSAGDILGYSMRGGEIFVKGNVGYRVGIHMKSYKNMYPVIIIGGCARDFLGEYMAGGLLIVLGLNMKNEDSIVGSYCGTGMHGGKIFIRGNVEPWQLGKEVRVYEPNKDDFSLIGKYLRIYCRLFSLDFDSIIKTNFTKLLPGSSRPYGKLYAY